MLMWGGDHGKATAGAGVHKGGFSFCEYHKSRPQIICTARRYASSVS